MTVSANSRRREYAGNGVTTVFNGPMTYDRNEIQVFLVTGGDSVPVPQGDFTVTRVGRDTGVTVTMSAAPGVGQTLVILRTVEFVQDVDITNQGAFLPETIEKGYDQVVFQTQQLADGVSRAIRLPDSLAVAGISTELPAPAGLRPLVWSVDGTSLENGDTTLTGDMLLRPNLQSGTDDLFLQSGSGAVPRGIVAKQRDVVSGIDFGMRGDGATNDVSALQTALSALNGRELQLPAGVFLLGSHIDLPAGARIRGAGAGRTILKRSATTTDTYMLSITGPGVSLSDLTVDGNSLSNPNVAHNILIQGGSRFTLTNVESRYAKGAGDSYGCGIAIVDAADGATNRYSALSNVSCTDNDVHGVYISKSSHWKIVGGTFARNSGDGIAVVNQGAPPATPTETEWSIVGATCAFNSGSGIGVSGFANELLNPTSYSNVISACNIHHNVQYGLAYQSVAASIVGNTITTNGSTDFDGGVLLNAQRVTLVGNTIANNTHYGIDAGGCYDLTFTGNTVQGNVGPAGGGTGINLGAAQRCVISGNTFSDNGGANGGENIGVRAYDGGAVASAFRANAGQISITGNRISLANSLQHGILVTKGDPDACYVADNTVFGGSPDRAFKYEAIRCLSRNNWHYADGLTALKIMAPADPLVIPDDGCEDIVLSGAAVTINSIKTVSSLAFEGKVRAAKVTNRGTGYSSPPTLTITGGGGSGATATALIHNGEVRAIEITNLGGGYSSAPTVTITGGGGSGATATVLVGCNNYQQRPLRIRNLSVGTVIKNGGGNVLMGGGTDFSPASDRGCLQLQGLFGGGNWYEVSRSA